LQFNSGIPLVTLENVRRPFRLEITTVGPLPRFCTFRHSSLAAFLFLLTLVIFCAAGMASAATPPCTLNPASPSVTICEPANGASVTSPVPVIAGTTDNADPVTAMIVYLDNAQVYKVNANQLSTSLTMGDGEHNITVNAWDSSGAVFKTTVIVTAGPGTGPISVAVSPSSATLAPGNAQQFTATVLNTSNTAVTWKVDGVANGNSSVGTITAAGLYTAPASNGSHTVVAGHRYRDEHRLRLH
jgi:hypothetical protein